MILTILFLIGLAAIAIEVADSELSNSIKKLLFIDRERSFLIALGSPKNYFSFLPQWIKYTIIIPIIIWISSFLFKLVRGGVKLIACPICLSMWMGAIFSYTYLNYPLIPSILLGGLTMAITIVLDKFKNFTKI